MQRKIATSSIVIIAKNVCLPSEEEHDKRVIHGTQYIWNDNTYSWNMTNMINITTLSDGVAVAAAAAAAVATAVITSTIFASSTTNDVVAAAAAIDSTIFASPATIDTISFTGQKLLKQRLLLPLLLQMLSGSQLQLRTEVLRLLKTKQTEIQ